MNMPSNKPDSKAVRPSLRQEQKRLTRERLLDAAAEVFEAVGFRNATIEEIAARSGANRTTVYLHFKDKVEIGRALAERMMHIAASHYLKLGDMRLSRAGVKRWVVGRTALRKRYAMLWDVEHEAATSDREMAVVGMKWHRDVVKQYWAPLLNRKSAEQADALISRIILLNTMEDRFLFLASAPGFPISMTTAINEISELWWRGVFQEA
jgi:AcrR family transcriptional regulator